YSHRYLTYQPTSWGISAGDGPNEYRAYGAQPAKANAHNGTIVPYAAVASINYLEYESLMATLNYASIPELQTTYGFSDAYNLGPVDDSYNQTIANLTPWYDSHVLGIDKGITTLMIENYRTELIWNMFMQNEYVQDGLTALGFVAK
ncbi:MAG: glucoamylase family protein, partial [Bacilli bacterium]